ncbi:MAG: radical SAM family heme chaperone HemW [Campylobacterales bacterium]
MLYIHIPFCDTKCPYCSFNSFVGKKELENSYLKALIEDFKKDIDRYEKKEFKTVYIGGGTPSVLSPSFYEALFKHLEPYTKNTKEITIEANPNSFNQEFAKTLLALGVKRVSFGIQSLDKKKLSLLGRKHSKKEALNAIELAQKTGFERLSADLIYGVRGDSFELLKNDLDELLKRDIEHISAYALSIEKGSAFFSKPCMSVNSCRFGEFIKSTLQSSGLRHYEVSNYGKTPSLHNRNYWRQKEYIGIGAGAVGFVGKSRITKQKVVEKYIQNQSQEVETLSSDELRFERLFMGLRSDIGVSHDDIIRKDRLNILEKEGRVFVYRDRVFCSDFFLADEVVLFLEK